jgi:hypothetical protein
MEEILNVEATYVAFPGTQLKTGNVSGMEADGNGAQGLWLYTHDSESGDLLAVPRGKTKQCNFGAVLDHRRFLDVGDFQEPRSPVLSLQRADKSGSPQLEFHRLTDCSRSSVVLSGASLPLIPPPDHPLPVLLVQQADKLIAVDPWEDVTTDLETGVQAAFIGPSWVWTLSDGTVTARSHDLKKVVTVSDSVTEWVPWQGDAMLYVSAGSLYWAETPEATPKLLAQDACGVAPAGSNYITFRSPCSDGTVVVSNLTSPAESLGFAASGPFSVLSTASSTSPWVAFLDEVDPSTGLGVLKASRLGEEPVIVAQASSLVQLGNPTADGITMIVEQGTVPRLIRWTPSKTTDLAEHATAYLHPYAVVDHDGTSGRLVEVGDTEVTTIAAGVPDLGDTVPPGRALLRDFDGQQGTLVLLERKDGKPSLRTVSEQVPWRLHLFLLDQDGISYMTDYDTKAGTGRLEVRFLKGDSTYHVENVRQWGTVGWPSPAIVYLVPQGPQAGIWHAEID